MLINKDTIEKIKHFHDLLNKGMYGSAKEITDTYNAIFNQNRPVSNCSSCIRRLVLDMVNYIEKLEGETKNG